MANSDITRIRELAKKVRAIAELDIQNENRKIWEAVNDLRMIRPAIHTRDLQVVVINKDNALTPGSADPFLAAIEQELLLRLYEWEHLRCDRVISPFINCPAVIVDGQFGIETKTTGVVTSGGYGASTFLTGGEYNSSLRFEPQIFTEDDIEKIKMPDIYWDKDATYKKRDMMNEVLDGILGVKLSGVSDFHHAPWDQIIRWMGVTETMNNLALEPEFMHKVISRYTQCASAQLKVCEELGIVSSNNSFENVGNNDPGFTTQLPPPTESGIGCKLKDIWGHVADQIFTAVSPAMSSEFAFAYEGPYSEAYGLFSYGCCERLDNKIARLKESFPRLRKVSVSPFSDKEAALEQLGPDYVACFKPNSLYLSNPAPDFDFSRRELIEVCELAQKYNNNLVINMKTIITLRGEPERLWKWCDMAREVVDSYYR